MKKRASTPADAAELRRRAEHRVKEKSTRSDLNAEESQRLIHELQVHQIELELQNEQLQEARAELEVGLQRYSDLYGFAPLGYVTLDRDGTIQKVNLAGARLLGLERSRLVGARFGLFVTTVCRPTFDAFLRKVFGTQASETCDVGLCTEQSAPLWVRIEAIASGEGHRECRAILTDISKRKQADAYREMARDTPRWHHHRAQRWGGPRGGVRGTPAARAGGRSHRQAAALSHAGSGKSPARAHHRGQHRRGRQPARGAAIWWTRG